MLKVLVKVEWISLMYTKVWLRACSGLPVLSSPQAASEWENNHLPLYIPQSAELLPLGKVQIQAIGLPLSPSTKCKAI